MNSVTSKKNKAAELPLGFGTAANNSTCTSPRCNRLSGLTAFAGFAPRLELHHDDDGLRFRASSADSFFEKLAQQKVLQVKSAADSPQTLLLGKRAAMAFGNDLSSLPSKEQGKPFETVYASEGSLLIIVFSGVPQCAQSETPQGCLKASSSGAGPTIAGG